MAIEYKDYYAILGVKKEAPADEIKQAYRRLARLHHPDLHPEKDKAKAAEKFKEVNEAYEVLSDPQKKAKYDQIGPGWDAREAPPPPRGGFRHEFRTGGGAEAFGGFSDFFESLFGGGAEHPFEAGEVFRTRSRKGQDIEAELPLSLEDVFQGGDKRISINAPVLCPACGGTGRKGRGLCPACGGVGEIHKERTITVHLPKHVRDGARLRLRGQGAPDAGDGEPGDLFLRVRLLPHAVHKVTGSDLETTVTVPPWDAALGGEAVVPSLEGPVRIKIPPGTHAGKRFRITGKGLMQEDGARGALYAVVKIDIPEKMDARMEKLYREMKEASK